MLPGCNFVGVASTLAPAAMALSRPALAQIARTPHRHGGAVGRQRMVPKPILPGRDPKKLEALAMARALTLARSPQR